MLFAEYILPTDLREEAWLFLDRGLALPAFGEAAFVRLAAGLTDPFLEGTAIVVFIGFDNLFGRDAVFFREDADVWEEVGYWDLYDIRGMPVSQHGANAVFLQKSVEEANFRGIPISIYFEHGE